MKKIIYLEVLTILVFLMIISSTLASNSQLKLCQNNCSKNNNQELKDCTSEFKNCINETTVQANCSHISSSNLRNQCVRALNKELVKCSSNEESCLEQTRNNLQNCNQICNYASKNITCENGKYNAGDYFLDGCNSCKCNFNGKIQCLKSNFCNFNDFSITEAECISNKGLFQQVCGGETYSKQCSADSYCQCSGVFNYTCPQDYTCLKNFTITGIKTSYASLGWIKLPGLAMGNSGICVKNQNISTCGDNICENKCNNTNCKNAETSYNCPVDCK